MGKYDWRRPLRAGSNRDLLEPELQLPAQIYGKWWLTQLRQ